jgi:two-component system cell cycle sensor histidine kinase/response regulator CckA
MGPLQLRRWLESRLASRTFGFGALVDLLLLVVSAGVVAELWIPEAQHRKLELPAAALLILIGLAGHYSRRVARRADADAAAAREALAVYARGQAGVRMLGERALAGAPMHDLLEAGVRLVAAQLRVSHSALFELRPARDDLLLLVGSGWDPDLVGSATIGAGPGSHARTALAGYGPATVALGDEVLFAKPPLLRGQRIVSGLSVLVRGDCEPFGLLAAYSDTRRDFSEMDAQFLQLVADLFSNVLRRRNAEAELTRSEERLRLALELSQMGTFDNDLVTGAGTWSTALCEILGVDPAVQPGHDGFLALVHPEDRAHVDDVISAAVAGGADYEIEECRLCRPDGQVRRFFARGTVLRDSSGRPIRILGVALDVTERRLGQEQRVELEAQLRQAQKMEAVGQLAGGIAHDFNNLLLALRGYGELALRALGRGDDAQEEIEEMLTAADRAAALTKQLLAFSRRQVLQPQVVDLNFVVAELDKLLSRLIGEDVEVEADTASEPVNVYADRGQLEQVITNLALNARDAMPDGGKLTIRISSSTIDEDLQLPLEPGRYALLAVSDTGIGMDPETAAQIFEPFFTTKDGMGTGLGLATVHGIVKQSGGHIWVYSEPDGGTTFQIYLPQFEDDASAREPASATAVPHGQGETILLVEDDAEVRIFVNRMLVESGYRVLATSSGDEALELAGERRRIDLLLTDVVMRGLSGRETAERLRRLQPDVAVLYMSGYTDDVILRRGVLERDTAFLQKPFGSADLAREVRRVLDAR